MNKFTILLILFSFLLVSNTNDGDSKLEIENVTIFFPNMRVYLLREVASLDEYPIIDLREELPNNISYEDLIWFDDTVRLQSTFAYKLINTGLKFQGERNIKVILKKQYKVVINEPVLPKQYKSIGNIIELDSAFNKDGVISFTDKPFKAPKTKEIKNILAQMIIESDTNSSIHKMSVSELFKRDSKKLKEKPNWEIKFDRYYMNIYLSIEPNGSEFKPDPYIFVMEQI